MTLAQPKINSHIFHSQFTLHV